MPLPFHEMIRDDVSVRVTALFRQIDEGIIPEEHALSIRGLFGVAGLTAHLGIENLENFNETPTYELFVYLLAHTSLTPESVPEEYRPKSNQ